MILDALENLMEGRTSFMIAHRLSTIRDANLILVLNHGMLVEQGTHEQLLAEKGLYYQLYEAQTGRAAAIEAQYAQDALAAGDSSLGVSDILAEVATAEALARYEGTAENGEQEPEPEHAANGDGADTNGAGGNGHAGEPARSGGLWAPLVPQPGGRAAAAPPPPEPPAASPPPSPAPASEPTPAAASAAQTQGGEDEITDKVIETLADAVRQRIRAALAAARCGRPGAERAFDIGHRQHGAGQRRQGEQRHRGQGPARCGRSGLPAAPGGR